MYEGHREIYITIIAGGLLMIVFAGAVIIAILKYQQRKALHEKDVEILEQKYNQELLRTQLEIQEQTFKTIAQEIHDNIGQVLILARLNLNSVDWKKEQHATEKISDARELIGKALLDLRDLSKSLNADTIAATGLIKAIEIQVQMLQKTGALQSVFEISGTPVSIEPQKELILFRITQEALHNVIKHANATSVRVSAAFKNDCLDLLIADDGDGFEPDSSGYTGSGLRNMQNRSKIIGALFSVSSSRGNGTQINLSLPISNNNLVQSS